ncbi:TetR family transcriptional regulator C-terminal domain-containing protein [Microbacterium halophytorum]|uniref:TetR family transcriptional regulator C-terminal domain-containing protein n=1 Tax=Microbacterium halophytorum TaxID=2067568 RepID=UPI000CFD8E20|nr:TetR family transcriptional regulator C-terminal domain-containing protein [Microbacterium halophytorum]
MEHTEQSRSGRKAGDRGVAARARAAIRDSGLAQREIAARMGLDETKLSKSLGQTRRFTAGELLALASLTGVTVDWLLTDDHVETGVAAPAEGLLPGTHDESDAHALRRRTIVEHAWRLFAERGLSGVRISDIAEAAGVSNASVHYYFSSKQDLFAEALPYSVKLAFDRQSAELPQISDPVERLRTLIRMQLPTDDIVRAEWSIWMQTWVSVVLTGDEQAQHSGSYQRWWRTVREALADGQASGAIVDDGLDGLTNALTAFVDGLGIRVLTGLITTEDMTAQVDHFIERFLLAERKNP